MGRISGTEAGAVNLDLPPNVEGRMETGPVRFGDDWRGVFIRGDEALYLAHVLKEHLNSTDFKEDTITPYYLASLAEILCSCQE